MEIDDVIWIRRVARNGAARAIREGACISGSELARQLEVSPAAVSRWERGERIPRADKAEKWAQLLRKLSA